MNVSYLKRIFTLTAIFFASSGNALLDLEESAQDFVLELKKIDILDYPNAFNPSIIRWNGSLLLSFRDIPNPLFKFTSRIGLVWLNEDFSPRSSPQFLDMQAEDPFVSPLIPPRVDDARLVAIGERLYLVYSDNKDLTISKGGFRVYIGEIGLQEGIFSLHHIECLSRYEGETKELREKNWPPFDYQGNMLIAYSISPHRIFRPLIGTGECESFSLTMPEIEWDWGELRGGTPALMVDGQYLAFFHSSKDMETVHSQGQMISHYVMGAYTFSSSPPFEITQISKEPIVGKGFYSGQEYKPFWKPVRVVFPCGFIFDEEYVWVAYGRQDHELWVVKLDKKGLLDSLIPVTTRRKGLL